MAGASSEAESCVVPGVRENHYREGVEVLQIRNTALEIGAEDSPIFEVKVQFSREYLEATQGRVMGGRTPWWARGKATYSQAFRKRREVCPLPQRSFIVTADANIGVTIIESGAFRSTYTTGIRRLPSQRPPLPPKTLPPKYLPRALPLSEQCQIILVLKLAFVAVHLRCGTLMIPPSRKVDLI